MKKIRLTFIGCVSFIWREHQTDRHWKIVCSNLRSTRCHEVIRTTGIAFKWKINIVHSFEHQSDCLSYEFHIFIYFHIHEPMWIIRKWLNQESLRIHHSVAWMARSSIFHDHILSNEMILEGKKLNIVLNMISFGIFLSVLFLLLHCLWIYLSAVRIYSAI